MIAAFIIMSSMWWAHRIIYRRMQFNRATKAVGVPAPRARSSVPPLGLEDDPDQWHTAGGAWTALDDRQLSRLLGTRRPSTEQ